MAPHVSSIVAMPQVRQPEQVPVDPLPVPADPSPTGLGGNRLRPLEVAECSLCGAARPLGLLIPDGGSSCDGIRWYCKDVKSCTERWVTARPSPSRPAPARLPTPFGHAPSAAPPPPAPSGAPADVPGEERPIASLVP
jgi:hypothetical protein